MKSIKYSTLGLLVSYVLLIHCEFMTLNKEFYIEKGVDDGINKTVKIDRNDAVLLVREINASSIHKKKIGMWVNSCNFRYVVLAIGKNHDTTRIVLSGSKFKIINQKGNKYFISSINIENLLTKYIKTLEE